MKLIPTELQHLNILKGWIDDKDKAYFWSGPGLRYPYSDESFLEDMKWGQIPSWSLVTRDGKLLGFGQYYENHGKCHLARLIVAPEE